MGIVVALNNTWKQFSEVISPTIRCSMAGREFYTGNLAGVPVVLVRSPMGKVNNAVTVQLLVSSFPVDSVISFSPAGALTPKIRIGDLVVANKVYQHDFGTIKPYGFLWNRVPVGNVGTGRHYNEYPDRRMANFFLKICSGRAISSSRIIEGCVVSGDQFVASSEKKKWLQNKFHALAVDMGAASIVQVCFLNRVPVLVLRIITDKADANARPTFGKSVGGYSTSIDILNLLKEFLIKSQMPGK